jgi:hypothetical protein
MKNKLIVQDSREWFLKALVVLSSRVSGNALLTMTSKRVSVDLEDEKT